MTRHKDIFADYQQQQEGGPMRERIAAQQQQMQEHEAAVRSLPRNSRHWHIDDYHIDAHTITADLRIYNSPQQVVLQRQAVDEWLQDTGRLKWTLEAHDGEGHTEYVHGTTDTDDYWLHADLETKLLDLKQYIIVQSKGDAPY